MTEYLPIIDSEGLVDFPGLMTLCWMTLPGDEDGARRAWQVLRDENTEINAGLTSEHTFVGRMIQAQMAKSLTLGQFVGFMAVQMRHNLECRGAPSFNHATYLLSIHYQSVKNSKGRTAPSDPKRLRTEFGRFKRVVHYWAAYALIGDRHAIDRALQYPDEFEKLMVLAAEFQNYAIENQLIRDFRPLKVPLVYDNAALRAKYDIKFPDEPKWVSDALADYSAAKIR